MPKRNTESPAFTKETTQLVVSVSVNGEARGDFFAELDDEGGLFLLTEDIDTLKLKIAKDKIVLIRDEGYLPLSALLDVRCVFDEKTLTVAIVGKTAEAEKTVIELYSGQSKPQNVYYPREASAFLNYGVTYGSTESLGFQSFSGASSLGLHAGDIFLISDSLYTKTEAGDKLVRLSSNATYEWRNELRWLVAGDQFANSGDLGSTVNMGGIGFSKVFALDPYLITQPLFGIEGAAAYPSQAEIYLDGVLVAKKKIAPGSFELKNIYSFGGSHQIDVVLKDPFGEEQRISYPLYFSATLLGQGLHEYSYHVGFSREGYGVESNAYGKPVFSAFHRYGVTSSLNLGARAEGAGGAYNGGISASFLIPRGGSFTASLAGSMANGNAGMAGSFQHSYQFGRFNTNLRVRGFSPDYATAGTSLAADDSLAAGDTTKYEASLGAGFFLDPLGSLSLSYSEGRTYGGEDTRVASVSFSRGLSRTTSLFMTASATRQVEMTYSFFAGFNFYFGSRYRGAAQYGMAGSANTQTLQMQKDLPVGEGLGYRASLNRSGADTTSAYAFNPSLQYNARYGTYSLDSSMQSSSDDTSQTYHLSAAGSLVYAGGFYGLSRPVNDSFGIVMVGELPDVTVLNNGSEVAKTGSSGMAVVPSLASYSQNQITVDVKNIPMDYSLSGVNVKLSPSLWSGSCISFDVVKVQALTGSLHALKDDRKIPLEFVEIKMKAGDREMTFPTGKGGEFYMENELLDDPGESAVDNRSCNEIARRRKSGGSYIQPGSYPAWAEFEGKKCEFSLTFPDTEDVLTDVGEVRCVIP